MEKRLTRSTSDRMIAGICGGIGHYFGIDPTLVRLVFAGALLLGMGSPVLFYFLLWAIVPPEDTADSPPREILEANVGEIKSKATEFVDGVKEKISA